MQHPELHDWQRLDALQEYGTHTDPQELIVGGNFRRHPALETRAPVHEYLSRCDIAT